MPFVDWQLSFCTRLTGVCTTACLLAASISVESGTPPLREEPAKNCLYDNTPAFDSSNASREPPQRKVARFPAPLSPFRDVRLLDPQCAISKRLTTERMPR